MMDKEKQFRRVLAHELKRATDAFDEFVSYDSLRLLKKDNKSLAIKSYEKYTDFVAHLYEFYVGCVIQDNRTPNHPTTVQLDALLTTEAEKHLKYRRDAIDHGYAPPWENDRSHYQVEVPEEFGRHWRYIRNRRNHVTERRYTGEDISVSDFFEKYHRFIFLLFERPQWNWLVEDIEAYDWGDIENFGILTEKMPSKAIEKRESQ